MCMSLKLLVNLFWLSCYFFWSQVFPFSCLLIAVMSLDLKFHELNRGASASWAKLQVGRISKYFRKYIQALFLSLSSVLKGWASFFLSSSLFADYVVGYGNCYNIVVGSSLNSIRIDISSKYGGVIIDHVVTAWVNVYVCRFQSRDHCWLRSWVKMVMKV